jgi:hypothetical protein
MTRNLWRTGIPSVNYYGSGINTGTEPDMRQELTNTLDGSWPEVAKGQNGLLRIMRRDANSCLIPCGCVDSVTHEPDKDRWCPVCFGEGYMWDEEFCLYYRVLQGSDTGNATVDQLTGAGLLNIPIVVFYIRYSAEITKEDKVVILTLNEDGSIHSPYQRKAIYRIEARWDYRSDGGKLDYYKAFTHLESVKYLNAPDYGDLG